MVLVVWVAVATVMVVVGAIEGAGMWTRAWRSNGMVTSSGQW